MGINISGLGIANAIGFKPRVDGGRRFLPPNIQSSLVSVISTYGKKNTDSDRNILKDKTGKGNDFKLLNFGFARNSGYGLYEEYFDPKWEIHPNQTGIVKNNTSVKVVGKITNEYLISHPRSESNNAFRIKVTGIKSTIRYVSVVDSNNNKVVYINSDGIYDLPASNPLEGNRSSTGFYINSIKDVDLDWTGFSIEIIPDFEGWLCTDGVDDMIVSEKTVSEMLEGSNEITVVSIIHSVQQDISSTGIKVNLLYNYFETNNWGFVRNSILNTDVTGIIGYTYNLSSQNQTGIFNILGDKENYNIHNYNKHLAFRKNTIFSVNGSIKPDGTFSELSQIAYAGGFIANKVLTTDEINQVIAYYNLDRPGEIIKPSMLYDIRKQGITNVNHAEFNDELIDYINGYNIKMYNMLWDKQSGIGNYPISFKDYTYLPARATVEVNKDNFVITANTSASNFLEINTKTKSLPTYKVKIEGTSTITNGKLGYRLNTVDGTLFYKEILKDGEYEIPEFLSTETDTYSGWCITGGFNDSMNIKITLLAIDDITDAIVLNGIDNFGKVTNVPIWKDYTICALRKWLYTASVDNGIGTGGLISKSKVGQDGAFIAEQSFLLNPNKTASYNFGAGNSPLLNDKITEKSFAIQTKYTYGINRQTLSVGSSLDTNTLWLGTVRDNDPRFSYLALWNLMLFPYTMSNFILERQLKKYKLGSLYPDNSFPFRPIVTSNGEYNSISYYRENGGTSISIGSYIEKNSIVLISIRTNGIDEVLKVTVDGKEVELYSVSDNYYRYKFVVHNSYPKIDITIEEYIRYEDIVQPYPVMFKLVDKDTNKEYTYGDKIKIGSIINIIDVLYNPTSLYTIYGYKINGKGYYGWSQISSMDIDVTKTLTFTSDSVWLLSTAEPLFIYDPSMINNIGLKNLGYLPDISGQNRHLKLYNFSYEGMSGKDGYPVVFGKNKTWTILRAESDIVKYDISSNKLTIYKTNSNSALLYSNVYNNGTSYLSTIPSFKLKVTGIRQGRKILYRYISESNRNITSDLVIVKDGTYDMPQSYQIEPDESTPNSLVGFIVDDNNDATIILEVLPDYKDSLYFDGVNDYGTVQNLDHGGKCLVSKLNYNLKSSIIYDQRSTLDNTPDTNTFALYIGNNNNNVYSERLTGDVYINNVLNNYIGNTDLNNNTHVVTATCSIVDSSNSISPIFGRSKTGSTYAQFAMYRTILLPEVPNAVDRAILNKWCGIPTGYLPKPEYYWDVTGKSNSDTATRNTIKNLGTAKPVASTSDEDAYSLENKNVAYEGMSGYNGYPVVFGANKTWNIVSSGNNWNLEVSPNIIKVTKALNAAITYSYVYNNDAVVPIEIPSFKLKITGLKNEQSVNYFYINENNPSKLTYININQDGVYTLPKSVKFAPTETPSGKPWIGIVINNNGNLNVTLEILPEYPNGLCLDGITNYVECANVPAFTDYTYIIKYKDFDNPNLNSCIQRKGNTKLGGGAFVHSYISAENKEFQLSFGASNGNLTNTDPIQYCTKTNYNGTIIKAGTNTDDLGITIGKWNQYRKMVFYKEMLWSKSINNTYHINMLRNLINNGGIIDLNDSIFDQTSNE
jgi:hypothetical protein